jgi:hypothetical protein
VANRVSPLRTRGQQRTISPTACLTSQSTNPRGSHRPIPDQSRQPGANRRNSSVRGSPTGGRRDSWRNCGKPRRRPGPPRVHPKNKKGRRSPFRRSRKGLRKWLRLLLGPARMSMVATKPARISLTPRTPPMTDKTPITAAPSPAWVAMRGAATKARKSRAGMAEVGPRGRQDARAPRGVVPARFPAGREPCSRNQDAPPMVAVVVGAGAVAQAVAEPS